MNQNDRFSRVRRQLALEAKRVQFRAKNNQLLFSLFHGSGSFRHLSIIVLLTGLSGIVSSLIYFSTIYSTRYKSEFQFSIQNSGIYTPQNAPLSVAAGAEMAVIQNTQIAFEYLTSFDLFSAFVEKSSFESSFSSIDIDYFSRYSLNWNDEKKYEYWKNLIDKKVLISGGLIKVTFTSFKAEDANSLSRFIIHNVTQRLNTINENINLMLKENNYKQLLESQELYGLAVNELAEGRQKLGQIEPLRWAENVTKIIGDINASLLLSKSELSTLNSQRLERSPQAEIVEKRLNDLDLELKELKRALTTDDEYTSNTSVAESVRVISLLQLRQNVTQKLVQISYENYEISKQLGEMTRNFVQVFVAPNVVSISTAFDRTILIIISCLFTSLVSFVVLYALNLIRVRL